MNRMISNFKRKLALLVLEIKMLLIKGLFYFGLGVFLSVATVLIPISWMFDCIPTSMLMMIAWLDQHVDNCDELSCAALCWYTEYHTRYIEELYGDIK